MTRFQWTFLALVVVQAAHSLEEYMGRLFDVFAPARLVSGLVSANLETGFIVINVSIVAFGLWCFLWPVRRQWPSAVAVAWFWVVLGLVNGIGHPALSVSRRSYTPGVATALVLLLITAFLLLQLVARGRSFTAAGEEIARSSRR
jgi:hypothetical protein